MCYLGYLSLAELFRGWSDVDQVFLSPVACRRMARSIDRMECDQVYIMAGRADSFGIVHYCKIVVGYVPEAGMSVAGDSARQLLFSQARQVWGRVQQWFDSAEIDRFCQAMLMLPDDCFSFDATEKALEAAWESKPNRDKP